MSLHPVAFRRPWWLANTHLETVWARRLGATPAYHRELADTPDHDLVAIDYLLGPPGKPALIIFHGLEGCSTSHTVRQLATNFFARGWSVLVPHFRTCGVMNRLPRAYHAGDSDDAEWMISYAAAAFPRRSKLFAVGISLGGNVLARWLGCRPTQSYLAAAATISAPFELARCAARFEKFLIRATYGNYFLDRLKAKILAKLAKYPFLTTEAQLAKIKTIRQFDEAFTAPLHGFSSADDYYAKASASTVLAQVATPLLCIQADNDALVPPVELPANAKLTALTTRGGGHAGFVTAPYPGSTEWLSSSLENFFASYL